jgi:hypothetical protein
MDIPIVNRIHELREKSDRIKSIEASQRMGNKINKREHKLLHSKALVNARLDELVKLRQRFCATLSENSDSESENSESESENSSETLTEDYADILCDTYFVPNKAKDTHLVQTHFLDVILNLLWFASPSDKRPNDSYQMMLQRRRYMPFDYLADEAMDQLTEKDLDLILVSVSGLEDSTVEEHKANAMKFYQRAKLRVKQQDPYYPNAHDPSSMREKLEKIICILDDYKRKEVERLGQLKARRMKEIDFKKQAEVEQTLAHAHIETDTDVATETIMTKGHVDRKWEIWDEVSESDGEWDKVLLELEQECLDVYKRKKVEHASKSRTQLLQALSDSKLKLSTLLPALGGKNFAGIPCNTSGTIKEQLAAISPALEQLWQLKEQRIKDILDVQSQILKLRGEITGCLNLNDVPAVDESDLTLKKLEEYQSELQELQKEKSDRFQKVSEFVSTVHNLCAVLGNGMDVMEVHSDLNDYTEMDDDENGYTTHHSYSGSSDVGKTIDEEGQTHNIAGILFFRQARNCLSYEQYSAFLATIKKFIAKKQTREDFLENADKIFGSDNKDLYLSFQGLLNRNVRHCL